MKTSIAQVNQCTAWKNLEAHYSKLKELHLRNLFKDDPKRGERMVVEAEGIYFDYSKNRITDETLKLLLQLAEEACVEIESTLCFGETKSTLQRSGQSSCLLCRQ